MTTLEEEISAKKLSVILCTYNPRADFFSLALRSIGAQSLEHDQWDFMVVDNNSTPPLEQESLEQIAGVPVRIVKQPKQGLTHARIAGIEACNSDWIVFVDDDNELSSDYLNQVVEIIDDHPQLGTFGGISEGVLERSVGKFKTGFLPQLGIRNYGDARIEGRGNEWGEHEPIGAGLVVRMEIANAFVEFVNEQASAAELGRSGSSLLSGEDSLFSRLADQLEYTCAYEPTLYLRHYMSASRLTSRYLARLIYGHGRSYVLLERSLGKAVPTPEVSKTRFVLANAKFRLSQEGIGSAIGMIFWDMGFYDQAHH